jgi:LysR family transcriptional regulator, low CO2-responsive transcriptional regulator
MRNHHLRRYLRHGMFPQLVAFEACVRIGSVTRAAAELSLAQPTVSCLVKKLSNSMGGPVMAVRNRRIVATPLGLELLTLCSDVFDAFDDLDARLAAKAVRPSDFAVENADTREAAEL